LLGKDILEGERHPRERAERLADSASGIDGGG